MEAAALAPPDPGGERVRPPGLRPLPGPFLPETLPLLHNPRSTTRTPYPPVYFGHFNPLWTLLFYYFCWIKPLRGLMPTPTGLSFAPPVTLVENAGITELRQHSWATSMTSSPLARKKFVEIRTGTEERRRRPPSHLRGKWPFCYCHLPCGWLRLSTKTRFLCPGSGAVREGELPGEESLPRPLRPLEPGWGR